jgi:hypothetical protein
MFEPGGHAAARATLVRKRVDSLARYWPVLRLALGDNFGAFAREYVLSRPRVTSDSRADGRAFAAWLEDRGTLPDSAAAEVIRFDASYRLTAHGARRRRLPMVRLRGGPRPIVAISFPRPGSRVPLVVLLRAAWS